MIIVFRSMIALLDAMLFWKISVKREQPLLPHLLALRNMDGSLKESLE